MQVTVRLATVTDYDQFLPLYLGLMEFDRPHHPQRNDFAPIFEARAKQARDALNRKENSATLVAEDLDGVLVGYTILSIHDPGPASTDGTMLWGEIYELFVAEETRGLGAGGALIAAAEEWFGGQEVTRVRVESFAWNEEAISYYQRRGYRVSDVTLSKWLE